MPEIVSAIIAYTILPLTAILIGLLIRYSFKYSSIAISPLTILMLIAVTLLTIAFALGNVAGFAIAFKVIAGLLLLVSFVLLYFVSKKQSKKLEKKIKYVSTTGFLISNFLLLMLNVFLFVFSFSSAFLGSVGFFIIPAILSILILIYFHYLTIKQQRQEKKNSITLYVNIIGLVIFLIFSVFYNFKSSEGRSGYAAGLGIFTCQSSNPEKSLIAPIQRFIFPGTVAELDKDNTDCKDTFDKVGADLEKKIKEKKKDESSSDNENNTATISETKKETVVSPEGFDDSDLETNKGVKIEKNENTAAKDTNNK